jgi:hypothetical protein
VSSLPSFHQRLCFLCTSGHVNLFASKFCPEINTELCSISGTYSLLNIDSKQGDFPSFIYIPYFLVTKTPYCVLQDECVEKPLVSAAVVKLLHLLYEEDIVSEEVICRWHEQPPQEENPQESANLKTKVCQDSKLGYGFVEWFWDTVTYGPVLLIKCSILAFCSVNDNY